MSSHQTALAFEPAPAPLPPPATLTPMMSQYWTIKHQYPDALVFYRMGDFFELFFDDAVTAAPILDIALTRRGKQGDDDVPMCGVPAPAYEPYAAKLIAAGFKVALCDQVETPEQARARGGAKALVKRDVTRVLTPGTLTEETMLEARAAHYLAALSQTDQGLGLAWLDLSTGVFMTEAIEPGQLAASLARVAPREIIVPQTLYEQGGRGSALRLYDRAVTVQPDSTFDTRNARLRLENHYQAETIDAFGTFAVSEVSAAGVLLDYVERTQRAAVMHLRPPTQVTAATLMAMDAATRRNLELTETLKGTRRGSLLDGIDETVTPGGARLLAQRLQEPSREVGTINHRLDQVGFFVSAPDVMAAVRKCLGTAPDMERALARLSLDRGGPRDLALIRDGLNAVAQVNQILQGTTAAQMTPAVQMMIADLHQTPALHHLVDRLGEALIETPPVVREDGGFIRAGFDAALDQARLLRDDGRRLIAKLQQKYAGATGVETLKIAHNNILGYYIEVTAKRAEPLFAQPATYIHRQTMASAVRFTTVELNDLQRDVLEAGAKALALELALYAGLVEAVVAVRTDLTQIASALAVVDVSAALAQLAVTRGFCRPILTNDRSFMIKGGRHVVVEAALARDGQPFMANDADMSYDRSLWCLTGPNMAGKSTFLRQNALIIVMAQMGSYVPATSATIGVVDRLFSRVGASDDLAKGQSTFMVEMVETAAILNQATHQSFVILDEIGRGTATYDGLSIAWACLEYLHDTVMCRGLFATHYHELTALTATLPRLHLATMAVKEWQDQIIFLHAVMDGHAAGSYGIHVARLAGLPELVTTRAEQILEGFEKKEMGPSALEKTSPSGWAEGPVPQKTFGSCPKAQKLIDDLAALEVDALSPREALEILYQLKSNLENNKG